MAGRSRALFRYRNEDVFVTFVLYDVYIIYIMAAKNLSTDFVDNIENKMRKTGKNLPERLRSRSEQRSGGRRQAQRVSFSKNLFFLLG